jgi:hypothetical protein
LTDGHHPSFAEIEHFISQKANKHIKTIPMWLAWLIGKVVNPIPKFPVNTLAINKITSTLTINDQLARTELNWTSRSVIDYMVSTMKY